MVLRAGLWPMARKTMRMVSESNGHRGKARVHVSEFLAVAPTKAAYWNTPRPLAILGPSDDRANGLPLQSSAQNKKEREIQLFSRGTRDWLVGSIQ